MGGAGCCEVVVGLGVELLVVVLLSVGVPLLLLFVVGALLVVILLVFPGTTGFQVSLSLLSRPTSAAAAETTEAEAVSTTRFRVLKPDSVCFERLETEASASLDQEEPEGCWRLL